MSPARGKSLCSTTGPDLPSRIPAYPPAGGKVPYPFRPSRGVGRSGTERLGSGRSLSSLHGGNRNHEATPITRGPRRPATPAIVAGPAQSGRMAAGIDLAVPGAGGSADAARRHGGAGANREAVARLGGPGPGGRERTRRRRAESRRPRRCGIRDRTTHPMSRRIFGGIRYPAESVTG